MPDPITPARFTAMAQAIAHDTSEAPHPFRQAEALNLCLQALRSVGYGHGCEVVEGMLNGGEDGR